MDKLIYLDNAATTPVRKEVFEAMRPYYETFYGNASSIYKLGNESKKAIEKAREQVANVLGCEPSEVFFTGSGTEADNWALRGVALKNKHKGNHIITTKIEHHAILHTCEALEREGFLVTYLDVDENGLINLSDLENAITDKTILISVMFANNEIGTIEPIKEIGAIAKKHNVYFHTDAVQAVCHVPINVKEMNIDMLSLSAHKFYGPKGVGCLYIKKGVMLDNLIYGGGQEKKRRAGTENVAGIVGLGIAMELANDEMAEDHTKTKKLRDMLIDNLLKAIPHAKLNGHRTERLSNNVNISFEFIEGESMLMMLDMKGICGSSGSACTSGDLDPSHVLLAIGLPHEKAHGSLRLSLGKYTTKEDIEYVVTVLPQIVERLRNMSPLYEEYVKGCPNA